MLSAHNSNALQAFKKFEMVSLSLHESNPGHHVEATVFRFAHDLPDFLHSVGFGHMSSFPAGSPEYTAFKV